MKKIKNIAFYSLRISLTICLLFFLFHKIGAAKIIEIIKGANLAYLFIAGVVFLFMIFLVFLRWYMLLRASNILVPFGRAIISYSMGLFCNMFLPSTIGGDIARSFDVFEYAQDKSKIFATVILDRVSGLASVVLVSFFAIVIGYKYINDMSVIITFCILLGLVICVLLLSFSKRAFSMSTFVFNRFGSVKNKLENFNKSMIFFKGKKIILLKNLGVSVAVRLGIIAVFYFIALSLGLRTNVAYFFIFAPIIEAISSAPIAIGGLGVRDAATVFLFTKVGVSSEIAVGMSLINFAFMSLIGALGGIIYVLTLRTRRV